MAANDLTGTSVGHVPNEPRRGKQASVVELQEAVNVMDCISQESFSQIAAIARLARVSIDAYRRPEQCWLEDVSEALAAIASKAEDTENSINSAAELVGCNHISDRLLSLLKESRAAARRDGAQVGEPSVTGAVSAH